MSTAPTRQWSGPRARQRNSGTSPGATRWSCCSPGRRRRTSCATRATPGTPSAARRSWPSCIGLLGEHTEAADIEVFTYSAGATVGSDGLALLAREHPEAARRLGEVYHAAPDADFRGFVDDLGVYGKAARRVTTAVNLGDSALRLAGAVNRASRAGRPDLRDLSPESAEWLLAAADDQGLEIVQVHPDSMPGLSATSHTFWYDDPGSATTCS